MPYANKSSIPYLWEIELYTHVQNALNIQSIEAKCSI